LLLRDGNGAIYPVAKDCLDGIRDPLWFDMAPLCSLSMAIQSLPGAGPPSKSRLAIIALALEVRHCGLNLACCVLLIRTPDMVTLGFNLVLTSFPFSSCNL